MLVGEKDCLAMNQASIPLYVLFNDTEKTCQNSTSLPVSFAMLERAVED
jgi:hypothetical protein